MKTTKIKKMKAAYDHFLRLATNLAESKLHASDLLDCNAAFNIFMKKLTK